MERMDERILGRYQPLYEAGSGGFATVVVAYDTRMRREVAIKCIPLDERQQRSVMDAGRPQPERQGRDDAFDECGECDEYDEYDECDEYGVALADTFDDDVNGHGYDCDGFLDEYGEGHRDGGFADDFADEAPFDEDFVVAADGSLEGTYDGGHCAASVEDDAYDAHEDHDAFDDYEDGYEDDVDGDYGFAYDEDDAYGDEDGFTTGGDIEDNGFPEARPTVSIMADDLPDTQVTPGLREARTAARLNDPSIVAVYDFEVQDDTAYLIMENVDGLSLGTLMRQRRDAIDADVVAAVFKAVARALQTAHANHVLHLDIKPDNVLISRKGEVKVVDFGLARLADEGGFGQAAGGTVGYMPIEQMRREELDVRCDEWSLASSLYEMISGSNSFIAPSIDRAEDLIFDAELALPSLCMDGLDPDIDDILFCALEPYRDDRYDTVKEFAREMQPCLGNPRQGVKKLARAVSIELDGADDEALQGEASGQAVRAGDRQSDGAARGKADRAGQRVRESQRPLRDPVNPFAAHVMNVWLRVVAVAGSLVLAAVALNNTPVPGGWTDPLRWVVLAIVGVVAGVFPHAGALAGLLCLSVMLVIGNAPAVGIVSGLLALAWWFFSGRFSKREEDVVVLPALLGSFGFAPIVPFVAGWLLRPPYAMTGAAMAVVSAFALAGLGSGTLAGWNAFDYVELPIYLTFNDVFVEMVASPETWTTAASWIVAAGVMALFCNRGTRPFVLLGSACAFAIVLAGLLAGVYLGSGMQTFTPQPAQLVSVILAGLASCALGWMGVPPREDEHDL